MKYLLFLGSFIFLGACSQIMPGVYKVNNTSSGRPIFKSECSVGDITLCQRRAASQCPKGYQTLKTTKGQKTVSTPIYGTRYRTYYRSYYRDGYYRNGYRHHYYHPRYRAHTVRERYVTGYNTRKVNVQYLQFKCR